MLALLALAMAAFVGGHLVLSHPPVRGALVARLGEGKFTLLYGVLAGVTLVASVAAYGAAPYVELWFAGGGLRYVPLIVMPIAMILIVCAYATPNPTAVMQDGRLNADEPATGIIKVTRHPMMWGIVLWSGSHLLVNGDLASLILFGGLATLALAGMVHIDARKKLKMGAAWDRFAAVTSLVPFAAILAGRQSVTVGEIGWWRIGLGVAAYVALLLVHAWLFGVSPYPV